LLDIGMEQVTLSPDGRIAISEDVRDALSLATGATLTVEFRAFDALELDWIGGGPTA
jgi:hypothetical protein